jgi:hypothetical protein
VVPVVEGCWVGDRRVVASRPQIHRRLARRGVPGGDSRQPVGVPAADQIPNLSPSDHAEIMRRLEQTLHKVARTRRDTQLLVRLLHERVGD